APEDYRRSSSTLRQGPAPVTGVFPAGVVSRLLETGLQAIQLSPYRAGPPARRPLRLGPAAGFLACCCPAPPFRYRSAIRSTDTPSSPCPLRERSSSAPRGAVEATLNGP